MPPAAKTGVFLCQGGQSQEASPELRRLRWLAESGGADGRVFLVSQACQGQGAARVASLAAQHGLEHILLGACTNAWPGGALRQALREAGLPGEDLTLLNLCARARGELGPCLVNAEAEPQLRQALAAAGHRCARQSETRQVNTGLLVLGHGLLALKAAHEAAAAGSPVVLLSPGKRLAPPQALMGPAGAQMALELAEQVREQPGIEIIAGGELLSLAGTVGDFCALIKDRQGERLHRPLGAVLVAWGPPQELNLSVLPDSERIVSLEQLAALVAAPLHLRKYLGQSGARVGLALGLERQSSPAALGTAVRLGRELMQGIGAQVTLFTSQAKMASPDLEELSQQARGEGMIFFKFTDYRPTIAAEGDRLRLRFREEILGREMEQVLDLLAIDQRPAPDTAYLGLARVLGLELEADGSLQPDRPAALPTASGRGGVFVLGEARGPVDLTSGLEELGHTLQHIAKLLAKGSLEVPAGRVTVDRKRCALCLTCLRVCPQQAMDRRDRRPYANPLACTACGTCSAECPMDAISILNYQDQRYGDEIEAAVAGEPLPGEEPAAQEALVLACANSAGAALAAARQAGEVLPPGARVVEVPCAGRIDPHLVLDALGKGFGGVLLLSCHPQACYSAAGNTWAGLRAAHLRQLLEEAGMEKERLAEAACSPSQAREAVEAIAGFCQSLVGLGPNPCRVEARVRLLLRHFSMPMDKDYTIIA